MICLKVTVQNSARLQRQSIITLTTIVCTFATPENKVMDEFKEKLNKLFDRIPRRHTADNVKEMYSILEAYEDLLISMEANEHYEKQVVPFFEALDPIRAAIKKSNDNKASKKVKDELFDSASGSLKDSIEALMQKIG